MEIKKEKGEVIYHPQRKENVAPVIVDTIEGDDGVVSYVLENGNTIPKDRYDSLWLPQKGKIRPLGYKGKSHDFKRQFKNL